MLLRMSQRERRHFEAIARAMAEDDARRVEEAMALTPWERMVLGLELGAAMPANEAVEADLDRRALGQAELHAGRLRIQRGKRA